MIASLSCISFSDAQAVELFRNNVKFLRRSFFPKEELYEGWKYWLLNDLSTYVVSCLLYSSVPFSCLNSLLFISSAELI